MVYGGTRQRVSTDGAYSGKIFDTNLSVVARDLYIMALIRPRVTCRHYSQPVGKLVSEHGEVENLRKACT